MKKSERDKLRYEARFNRRPGEKYEINPKDMINLLDSYERLIEALKELTNQSEKILVDISKVKGELARMHSREDWNIEQYRSRSLTLAAELNLIKEGVNFYNITPAIREARQAFAEVEDDPC